MITTEIRRGPDPRRLRLLLVGLVLLAAAGLAWRGSAGITVPVMAGPIASSTVPPAPDGARTLGGVDIVVEVEPRVGLLDGDLVEVHIDGLANLPGATILQCAGDVSESNAAQVCDVRAVARPSGSSEAVPILAEAEQVVSVSRTIQVYGGTESQFYDCGREPAGCVLAVGPYALPPAPC